VVVCLADIVSRMQQKSAQINEKQVIKIMTGNRTATRKPRRMEVLSPEAGKLVRENIAQFRILGLKRGESRVAVIRQAAQEMASLLTEKEPVYDFEVFTKRRFEIALAAYRLLDPRRRRKRLERIHLCFPLDREELLDQPTFEGPTGSESEIREVSGLMQLPVLERVFQEEALAPEAVAATVSSNSWVAASEVDSPDLELEERREVVRTLRAFDRESETRGSTLNWLRSVFGL
jgi:hypothetical protein